MRLRGIQIDIHHGYTSQSILRKSLSILTRHFPYYFVVRTRAALSGCGRICIYSCIFQLNIAGGGDIQGSHYLLGTRG